MRTRLVLMVVLLAVAPFAFAKEKKAPAASAEDLAAITERGRDLFQYDRAAWTASDALMSRNPPRDNLGRYIARKTDAGWLVAFGRLSEKKDSFLVAYEVARKDAPDKYSVKRLEPPRPDTEFFLAAANAIETALADFQGPQRPYNAAALPATSGQLYVYIYPAQTKKQVIPLGGDVRYLISSDGLKIVEKRQLHKGILETTMDSPGQTVGGVHTHVLSDLPEDTDVFHALARRMPEYVGAGGHVYAVAGDGSIKSVK